MKSLIKKSVIVLVVITSLNFSACKFNAAKSSSSNETSKELIYYNETHIQQVRERIKAKDAYFLKNYEAVLKAGNAALDFEVDPVTNKTQIPPSKDMHDYLTYAPYRWPDPSKSDGLPWIAIDGIINPVSRGADTDYMRKNAFFDAIGNLAWTYYFSEDKRYAEKAIELIKVWYLDAETRVNPNINFGQGVPGIADGRKAGVHEWKPQADVITALQMFEAKGILPAEIKNGMVDWLSEYLHWLTTDTMAISAGFTRQNHANYYNHQVVGLMMYVGRNMEAKAIVEDAKQSRIADQIMPDGTQPREMGRTKSVSYTSGNLWLMTELVLLGRKLEVDLWDYETEDGRSMKKAYDYLVPFVLGTEVWPKKQITEGGAEKAIEDKMLPLFSKASTALEETLIDPDAKAYLKLSPLEALIYPPLEMLPSLRK